MSGSTNTTLSHCYTISKFGLLTVGTIIIIIASFEVIPLTLIPIATATSEAANNSYNIFFGRQGYHEEEHVIGMISSSSLTVITERRNDDQDFFTLAKNRKTIHQGFRIQEDVIRALSRQSKKNRISLSSTVNKILENHVSCDRYFEELGFILVSKHLLRKSFARLNEEHINKDSREEGLTAANEYLPYLFHEVNSNTIVQFLEIWFKRFQCYEHRINDGNNGTVDHTTHYFTVNHDININFSIHLKAFLEGLIEPIIKGPVKFYSLTSNAITFSFQTQFYET